jgi:conjugative transposon TraM protein
VGHEPDPEVEKLEDMIKVINTKNETDPELKQLSAMLDKILLAQHPEKLQDSIKLGPAKKNTELFSVSTETADQNISSLDNTNTTGMESQTDFYNLGDEKSDGTVRSNGIEAVIEETQTLVSGSTVKLRLISDIYITDQHIPKGQFVYGTASLNNERLRIIINSIRYQNNILPVSMDAYDMDGLAGIYVPGSISRDVSKQSADEAISSIGLTSLDPSVGAQAASAGIQAAKTLLGRKVKLTRVSVKAGYRVLLKDNRQK